MKKYSKNNFLWQVLVARFTDRDGKIVLACFALLLLVIFVPGLIDHDQTRIYGGIIFTVLVIMVITTGTLMHLKQYHQLLIKRKKELEWLLENTRTDMAELMHSKGKEIADHEKKMSNNLEMLNILNRIDDLRSWAFKELYKNEEGVSYYKKKPSELVGIYLNEINKEHPLNKIEAKITWCNSMIKNINSQLSEINSRLKTGSS